MSAITESDILARLDNLKITHEPVVEHEHCPGAAEWNIVLKGKDEWKGKSFSLSKTLLFKPKQPKSAAPTPVMVMIHGDDQGLVMPPRVSSVQVVIVPVGLNAKQTEEEKNVIFDACKKMEGDLISIGVRAKADLRDGYTPGWKFNDWELRGVPILLEIGPRDLAAKEVKAIRRVDGHKFQIANDDIKTTIPATLEEIHYLMFDKAKKAYDDHIVKVDNFDDVVPNLDAKNVLILPWCEAEACEDDIKERSAAISNKNQAVDDKAPSAGAKSLCIPHDQARFGEMPEGQKCVGCGQPAKRWTMFGRSY